MDTDKIKLMKDLAKKAEPLIINQGLNMDTLKIYINSMENILEKAKDDKEPRAMINMIIFSIMTANECLLNIKNPEHQNTQDEK